MHDATKLWLPPLATLASIGAVAALDAPSWVVDLATLWGPAFLLLTGAFAGMLYYIPRAAVADFVQAQKDQAVALSTISVSLTEISGHNGKLDSILDMQKEILMDLRVGTERFKRLEEHLFNA
jgi:4-amino-4-deoxy-L-arabinose transferase-like glycosyltransferase